MKPGRAPKRRLARGQQQRAREASARVDPDARRRELLADETGTIYREAPLKVGLCYPLPYRAAMSSLGYQVVYRALNSRPSVSCERVVLPDDVAEHKKRRLPLTSLETGRLAAEFDLLGVSATWDLDITGLFELLDLAGVPALRSERRPSDPPVLLGGPLTASNPLPFGPFIDLAVIGDGEVALEQILDILETVTSREDLLERAARIEGVWVPELHGDRVPATQKVTAGLPAVGQIITPHTELSNMFLIEASRGCPRFCKFCLVRAPESPMRASDLERVLSHVPAHAPRVGFVGAAVSEWEGIREALRRMVEAGKGIGISSLRADRLDADFVDLLARGGYRTMTVASDAPSQRLRNTLSKAIREKHLLNAAQLARDAGMLKLKLYVIVGLPRETDEDLDELVRFSRELSQILPTALGISPLVPKLHTPLGDAEFAGMPAIDRTLARLRDGLAGVAEVRSTSARWAWIEYRMSQGSQDAGLAAYAAWRKGGRFAAWRDALAEVPERGALEAARRHQLFPAAGMK
ncbi:MAG: radical SAM protein [Deltaproteobacteria bacterium]|nr:MAG: radical SAM protein [Deltaproteobacteria bacterium]